VKEEYKIYHLKILMLYSALPHEYQHQVFDIDPTKQTRKIILATNIAETSQFSATSHILVVGVEDVVALTDDKI
jgi:hypothetical protein